MSLSELLVYKVIGEMATSDIYIKLGAKLSMPYPHLFHQCRVHL